MQRKLLPFICCLFAAVIFFGITGCGGEEKPVPSGSSANEDTTIDTTVREGATQVTSSFLNEVSPGGRAVVKGTVSYLGTPPVLEDLDVSADPECAAANPEGLLSEELLVNEIGGVANAFVFIERGLSSRNFPVSREPVTLDQKGCRYMPHVFGVQAGQQIIIVNSDGTLHNVHALPVQSKEFNVGMPMKGMTVTKVFDAAEVMVRFKCDVHPWMSAYAGVLDHPFFAVTGEDGTFEITGLPAGAYKLTVWHEKLGSKSMDLVVSEEQPTSVIFNLS